MSFRARFIDPMLLQLTPRLPEGPQWLYELKLDGYRALAIKSGGVVRLTLPRPVAARYLLIWFTQLPPDGAGHYQETVSQVQVTGRR